uniref:NADH-ubiquinone oxidoreductase chain 2 n=1 Tax=Coryphopterus dicrus TaxID=151714 RepID=Q94W24_CORDC|nr:NADH dehydrogenase subunit 2 [Coryphopterus dicrus]
MSPYVMTLLLATLGLGTTVTFASSHWILAWMGLEINTLAMIPLMTRHYHPRNIEAATKYFLVQASAAATLLMATLVNAWLTGQWNIHMLSHPAAVTMVTLALCLKLGLAPLHTWLPEVLQGVDLFTGLILSTWQKLAPFVLLLQLSTHNQSLLLMLALASTLIGAEGGLNQTQNSEILAYSSIANLGWMILTLQFNPSLTVLALSMYIITTTATFVSLMINKVTTLNSLSMTAKKAPVLAMMLPAALLSLAGLPPLSGFLPKWFILQEVIKQGLPLIATFVAFSTLISLFFYLRLTYMVTLTIALNNLTGTAPWRLPRKGSLPALASTLTLSATLLPLAPTLQALIFL